MKATLVLQEGPGAGRSYPLDPAAKAVLSLGRSSDRDIMLNDHRASRHHADIRWNGRTWEVVDLGSTNGTYVNGLHVHQPYDLRIGDRVTIGETTLVLREQAGIPAAVPAAPAAAPAAGMAGVPRRAQPRPAVRGPSAGPVVEEQSHTAITVVFGLVAAVIGSAIVCLAAGAFLPWLRVTGALSEDMGSLVQGLTDIVSALMGPDSLFHMTQEIGGLEGYGKLTLGVAAICTIALAADVIFYRKSVIPGIVYLLSGAIAVGAMASDLMNLFGLYKQVESLSLMFGIQLGEVVQFLDRFVEMQVTPLIGLQLTVAGLVLLLVGGIGRLVVAFLVRNKA